MQRCTRLVPLILGVWFTVISCATWSLADDVPPTWYSTLPFYQKVAYQGASDALVKIMLFCFVSTLIVEYVLIYGLLGSPRKAWTELIFWVFFVNVVTNPAAQVASVFVADPGLLGSDALPWLALGLIELVVVIVEFGLLKWIFRRMYRRGFLRELVAPKRTFVIALVANLGSFLFGLVGWLVAQAVTAM